MDASRLFQQAAEACAGKDFATAVAICNQLLPNTVEETNRAALLNLISICQAGQGLMFDALDSAWQAVEIQPVNALLQHHLARLSIETGRMEAAEAAAQRACELETRNVSYRYHLAVVLLRKGELDQARLMAEECIRQDEDFSEARILIGEIEANLGNAAAAISSLNEVVIRNPSHERAWGWLADLDRDDANNAEIRQALESIVNSDTSHEVAATAGIALANMDRRRGKFEAAFAHCEAANRRSAQDGAFDLQAWLERVDQLMATPCDGLQTGSSSSSPDVGFKKETLLFIVGMPRSGSTLCEQILSAHPAVQAVGENPAMEYVEKSLLHRGMDAPAAGLFSPECGEDLVATMRRHYLESLPPDNGEYQIITDKAPRNFERLGLIFSLFPTARVLWCVRHPLDTILSCYFQDFGAAQKFSTDLMESAQVYEGHVRLMHHWLNPFRASIALIDYASMVQNLEATAHKMATIAGLDFHPAMVEPHRNQRLVRTSSFSQVKRPVYTSSINNWRHYPKGLAEVRAWLESKGLLDEHGRSRLLAEVP